MRPPRRSRTEGAPRPGGASGRRGWAAAAGLALALILAAPGVARAEGPYRLKPGARGPVCLGCHVDIQEQLERPSVHTPVREGECSQCHSPHASAHGKLLAADTATICVGCHADTVPPAAASVHQAVTGGGCVSCHDPHAAANPKNLMAGGNDLCLGCHDEIGAAVEQAEFRHAPVADSCLNCHLPHASPDAPYLLRAAVGDLCAGCHDTGDRPFVERHMGYDVTGADCTSCHDPHGSDRSGILRTAVHPPVASRLCNQCHQDPSSADALQLRRPAILLCGGCHNEVVDTALSRNRIHWPVVDARACLNCHSPHASDEAALLLRPQPSLCGGCHQDILQVRQTAVSTHAPVEAGECSVCHDPHGAEERFLMASAPGVALCGGCHDWQSHSSHPVGTDLVDPRNPNLAVDCGSCHRPHGSPFKGLALLDPGSELCVQCHEQLRR